MTKKLKFLETPYFYYNIFLPYIKKNINNNHHIGINIKMLSNKKATYINDSSMDTGFKLVKDIKWNNDDIDQLHCLAIVNRKDLYTLRDLTKKDVPLLVNIYTKSIKYIKDTFDINNDELYIYIHYHPSIFKLHIHFVNIKAKHLRNHEISICTAWPLESIIQNLEIKSNYYKDIIMPILIDKDFLHKYE